MKQPKPWYRASKSAWYVEHHFKQVRLGEHPSPDTYANYKHFLQSFIDDLGRTPAAEVKPIHVTRWLDAHPTWKGARRHAVIAVRRAFSWAEQQGVLASNPLRTLKAGRAKQRTRVLAGGSGRDLLRSATARSESSCGRCWRLDAALPRSPG